MAFNNAFTHSTISVDCLNGDVPSDLAIYLNTLLALLLSSEDLYWKMTWDGLQFYISNFFLRQEYIWNGNSISTATPFGYFAEKVNVSQLALNVNAPKANPSSM